MQLDLAFDADAHAYTLGGVRIPSVTQVLSFGQDLSRIPRWTAERGTAFHLATEYLDQDDLDWDSLDPLVRPHVEAYAKWKQHAKPTFMLSEWKVWGEIDGLRFAGTVDRVICPNPHEQEVIDLKSGQPRKEHGAQLAAYSAALQQREGLMIRGCKGVYCLKDGTFSEKPYDGREHLEVFRTKLAAWYAANGG